MEDVEPGPFGDAIGFRTTHWSVVERAAGDTHSDATQEARGDLYRQYQRPVHVLLRAKGVRDLDCHDLAQEFFQHFLSGHRLSRASQEQGRFRVWLRESLENFRIDDFRRRGAAKRGGGQAHDSFEEVGKEIPAHAQNGDDATAAFDREWALSLMEAAVTSLRRYYETRSNPALFHAFLPLLAPDAPEFNSLELGARLGLSSAATRKALERFRENFRHAIRHEVGRTVSDPSLVSDELRYLRVALTHAYRPRF